MTGLAHPPNRWDAETAKPGACNTGLAGYPGGWLENTADVTRHGTLSSSKDGCCVAARQERSWWGASALRWESEMDERPLHELSRQDVEGTDLWPEWWGLWGEACGVLTVAETLMRKWTVGPSPFIDRFPRQQLDRVEGMLRVRIRQVLDQLWYEFHYTDQQYDRQYHFFELMLRMMREGARDGDVEPVAEPAHRPVFIPPDLSESPIESALLGALRQVGRLCADPVQIAADCERTPVRCGIYIYQQAVVLKYRADFLLGAMASPDADPHWVVVECDGHEFHERTPEQAEHDRARDRAMTAAGYRVFRFTGREIRRDRHKCANEVIAYLQPFTRGLS